MVTGVQAGKAADGSARSLGRARARIGNRPLVAATIIAALLATLLAGVVASRAYPFDPAVVTQAGVIEQTQRLAHRQRRPDSAVAGQASVSQQDPDTDAYAMAGSAVNQPEVAPVTNMARQRFLEMNMLPETVGTSLPPGPHDSLLRQLIVSEERDYGPLATPSAAFDTPCPPSQSMCRR